MLAQGRISVKPDDLRAAACAVVARLDAEAGADGQAAFDDDTARGWIEYRPRPRPGICLGRLDVGARKAAHQLLATALSPHAYAQAMTIMALEEVLDRAEDWE